MKLVRVNVRLPRVNMRTVVTINTRDWPPSTSVTLKDLENSINELLDRVTIHRGSFKF